MGPDPAPCRHDNFQSCFCCVYYFGWYKSAGAIGEFYFHRYNIKEILTIDVRCFTVCYILKIHVTVTTGGGMLTMKSYSNSDPSVEYYFDLIVDINRCLIGYSYKN